MQVPGKARITVIVLVAAATMLLALPVHAQEDQAAPPVTAQAQQSAPRIPVVMVGSGSEVAGGNPGFAIQTARRSWYFGLRGGYYFDVEEPFVGVEFLFPLGGHLWFNPNAEWVFVDSADVASVNADVHYDLTSSGAYMFWIGAGLGLRYFNPNGPREGEWNPGLNLLAGLGFGGGSFIPYIQGKVFINDDNSEFILAGGFRF